MLSLETTEVIVFVMSVLFLWWLTNVEHPCKRCPSNGEHTMTSAFEKMMCAL